MAEADGQSFKDIIEQQYKAKQGAKSTPKALAKTVNDDAAAPVVLYDGPLLAYTPETLVQTLISEPGKPYAYYAAMFGYKEPWFYQILANEAFQACAQEHRDSIADPFIAATMPERLKALALQSLAVVQHKLSAPNVNDQTVLAAAALGVKGLGLGATSETPQPQALTGAEAVAERIMLAMAKSRAASQPIVDVPSREVPSGS